MIIDFSWTKKSPFDIKSESSGFEKTAGNIVAAKLPTYDASIINGSLVLGLKKTNCIAWVDIPEYEYHDHIIEAKIRLNNLGTYASTGIIFRIMDEDSYYLALVSSKGYFRFDAVKNNDPKALIAWTEISDFDKINIKINIITYGTHIIFLINDKWAGEIIDDTLPSGRLGFALASYAPDEEPKTAAGYEYTCKAMLDYISIDTRTKVITEKYKQYSSNSGIDTESRMRLAETFAVMGKPLRALEQIKKAWDSSTAGSSAAKAGSYAAKAGSSAKELLLAARMSYSLEQYNEAEEYIEEILGNWPDSDEGKHAYTEKIKILNELNKFTELKEFAEKYSGVIDEDTDYYAIMARCHWELKEYTVSAEMWEKVFRMNSVNGIYAVNAANALEQSGKNDEALSMFMEAGKIFLKEDNISELSGMISSLSRLGSKNWETRAFIGKWGFSIEDYTLCEKEFDAAEKLRSAKKPKPDADPALYYLWGLVHFIKENRKGAIRLLEKAVKLAPDYELFNTKLEEIKSGSGTKE